MLTTNKEVVSTCRPSGVYRCAMDPTANNWVVLVLLILRNQLRTREPIANNGFVIHLLGFSYLMRLEAECFALSLRELTN